MRKLIATTILYASFIALASQANASGLGQPVEWQMGLQQAATPVMEFIHTFHGFLLTIITIISLFVLGLLIYVMVKFNAVGEAARPVMTRLKQFVTTDERALARAQITARIALSGARYERPRFDENMVRIAADIATFENKHGVIDIPPARLARPRGRGCSG